MERRSFDLVVVGSGPGGYVAAIRASQLGFSSALVEREQLGGICLNWGCIPTKALLRTAELHHAIRHAGEFGLSVGELRFDLEKVIARSRKVAKRLNAGVKHLMKKHRVAVIEGHARLEGPGRLRVERDGAAVASLSAPHIVLATGARARTLPGIAPDGERIWTYREAMVPRFMPRSLLVVGSGAIGVEFASFYRDLGAEVTVVELLPQILPAEDAEIAALARRSFERRGMRIHSGARLRSLEPKPEGCAAEIEGAGGENLRLEVEAAVLAVGIQGNVENLGLEGSAVRVEKGHIAVNEWLETGEAGVYAIGDVAGPPWLAHKASHEGVLCVERIAGVDGLHPFQASDVPGCTYCRPQIASIGLSEAAAGERGHELRVGRFPFQANGKALALGEGEGLVKTVFDAHSGELLGAHLVGPEVTELIHGFALARQLETTEAELMATIFPHPTLSEAMHESVLSAWGRALNA